MGFDYPWVLALIVIIVPLLWVFRKSGTITRAIVQKFHSASLPPRYFQLRNLCAGLFIIALLLAGAGPYTEPRQTADYLFVVDTSRSMQARNSCDEPTFLDRAKNVMFDVMEGVPEARFGVVAFDRLAFPVTQLTFDHSYLRTAISNAVFVGMTYRATDTDMFNALRLIAEKKQAMPELYGKVQYVVLLSDGHLDEDDWRQNMEQPLKDLLASGITLLVVGVGNPVDTPVPVTDMDDVCSPVLTEIDGKTIRIPLRKDIMQTIAAGGQGEYFDESTTGDLVNYLRERTLKEADEHVQFGPEQRKNIGQMFLYPATLALAGLLLL
jgi:hypothetical protein